ncbi:HlyD family secretion protein [Aliivibrio fischeri]|uniref:HlyD family secretion protein n=1 Tax=Aliivibrio fischeri TaxID=668 RepID=UPI001F452907|nr:HlyD family secretion protein [Aliivibrio fischeri]MCE4935231.1 HlyD family secretion protein [Aliivibrio fischeri]
MQAAEQKFKQWMRILIVLFLIVTAYLVMADRLTPLTTQSKVQGFVVQISPEVSGRIVEVNHTNNQLVKKGELLFKIDDEKYLLAVQKAKIALAQAKEQEASLVADIEAARSNVKTTQVTANNANREYHRIKRLANSGAVSASGLDSALTKRDQAAANLMAAQQKVHALEVKLGKGNGQSSAVLSVKNSLKQAELDLEHTQVVAQNEGIITNMQLHVGVFANANQPLLTFIPTDSLWVSADYREKATSEMVKGMRAEVAYDAMPGEVFPLIVESRDYGVASAQQKANGQLSSVEVSNRWVRDAQRVRVNLTSDTPLSPRLFVGSRATVIIYTSGNSVIDYIGHSLITMISYLHYIY